MLGVWMGRRPAQGTNLSHHPHEASGVEHEQQWLSSPLVVVAGRPCTSRRSSPGCIPSTSPVSWRPNGRKAISPSIWNIEKDATMTSPSRKPCVVCWSEATAPADVYPADINTAVAEGLAQSLPDWDVVIAGLDDANQGIPIDLLNRCDVLVWWGHKRHGEVDDARVEQIVQRVTQDGMGFVSLHSAHFAKPNIALMSQEPTDPALLGVVRPEGRVAAWGAYVGDSLDLTVEATAPDHPITAGVPPSFTIAHHERYSDPYAVPPAEAILFEGDAVLQDGSIDHSTVGLCWTLGAGRMFYFQAGHETDPVFFDPNVRLIMANAVRWAKS